MEKVLFMIYAVALAAIVWFIMESRRQSVTHVIVDRPLVSWWPWNISRYNDWPYWSGWYVGGGNGGYYKPPVRPHHEPRHHDKPRHHDGPRQDGPHHGDSSRPWGGGGRTANAGAPSPSSAPPSSAPSSPSASQNISHQK
jgi:hypothetical protein